MYGDHVWRVCLLATVISTLLMIDWNELNPGPEIRSFSSNEADLSTVN